ncbi:hypothetical protein [Halodesulfovibrio spirochaetisodalis]|uniref:Uncharacterized protein n=1 Tax=Halodesulfovibrio spirochaetisodalis TaxID=1560234 RepID=A0A1B7XJH1_9BACT|nr:hypothetical protein [Halodesulfovibrio spirochaetisodalis]OBQ55677.1 hypothetical protein SP90_03340 [Halodesulfovibrio spirochaetisodalis]
MKVIENNHQLFGLSGFDKLTHSNDTVELKGKQLRAGQSWKGRIVSVLESIGIFKEYCTDFRNKEESNSNTAAWQLFGGLKEKYGEATVTAALENTKERFKGMDIVRTGSGLTTGTGSQTTLLTCGEVRAVMDEASAIHKYLELNPKPQTREMGTQTDTPVMCDSETQTERQSSLNPLSKLIAKAHTHATAATTHTETTATTVSDMGTPAPKTTKNANPITNTIKNHYLAKGVVQDEKELLNILHKMGKSPKHLSKPRTEYVTSKVLKDVRELPEGTTLNKKKVLDLAEKALTKALSHNSAWNTAKAIKMGAAKHVRHTNTELKDELKTLATTVKVSAKAYITSELIKTIAQKEGITLDKAQTKFAMKEAISSAAYTAEMQGIMLDTTNFDELAKIMVHHAKDKKPYQLFANL